MNIRDKLLNARNYSFEETDFSWHNNPVFKLKQIDGKDKKQSNLEEPEAYLGLTKEPLIFLNDLKLEESNIKPDFLIFASRHTSKTARPAFLVHTTGNWGKEADFGGDSHALSLTSALLLKAGFSSLIEKELPVILSDFSFDMEVTHHGPTSLEIPLIFMELGSSKEEWEIAEAGESVATAVINTIYKYLELKKKKTQEICLGFGGTHYAPNFHRLIESKNVAISFICPKYYIQELNREMISKMIHNTTEKVDCFLIDWKGTNSADKKYLIPLLEEFNVPIKKTKDF
ncbi:MAG: D-aminoacyl-tRNA deacylase [Candidatus Lokiarchaeota archaeon]|nr:D-aminoacyl-tRNA deacylase [Candidatus Lokiarchaeota archaeon]